VSKVISSATPELKMYTWTGATGTTYRIWHADGGVSMQNQNTGEMHTYFPDQLRLMFKALFQIADSYLSEGVGASGDQAAWCRDHGRNDVRLAAILKELMREAERHGDPTKDISVIKSSRVLLPVGVPKRQKKS